MQMVWVMTKDTSQLAGEAAARSSASRRLAILESLGRDGPQAIFELAERLEVFDHQISGRFGEMMTEGLIYKTGERRIKPGTKCEAEVYALSGAAERLEPEELLGYPWELKIADQGTFHRQPPLGDVDLPGLPYSLNAAANGGARLVYRVEIIVCPGCWKPIKFIEKGKYQCGTPSCNRTWYPLLVNVPGQPQMLALVMKHM